MARRRALGAQWSTVWIGEEVAAGCRRPGHCPVELEAACEGGLMGCGVGRRRSARRAVGLAAVVVLSRVTVARAMAAGQPLIPMDVRAVAPGAWANTSSSDGPALYLCGAGPHFTSAQVAALVPGQPPRPGTTLYASFTAEGALFGSASDQDVSERRWRSYLVIAGADGWVADNRVPGRRWHGPGAGHRPQGGRCMPEPIHPDNCAQPVAPRGAAAHRDGQPPLVRAALGRRAADPLRHGDPSASATASHLREQQFARPVN
jgi:hypothetical protein